MKIKFTRLFAKVAAVFAAVFGIGHTAMAYTNQLSTLNSAASDISDFFGVVWAIALSIVVAFILLGLLNKVRTRR